MKTSLSLVVVAFTTAGCGSTIRANVAYDAGHDIATEAGKAQAHFALCKADPSKCDSVDEDLKAIEDSSKQLQADAVAAGFDPGIKPQPATSPAQ